MPRQALGGVTVLECCKLIAGPYCAKLLADLGAEVIKVEEPELGDPARHRGPFLRDVPNPERSGLFLYLNTNKLGITLNLRTKTGQHIFRELAKQADILVESYPPQTMDELGLGYQGLKEINPRLVMTSVTPFGQTGPYRRFKAHHLNTYHGSGVGWDTWAGPDSGSREPIQAGGIVMDYHSGLSAAIGTLAAFLVALQTGAGQHVDISEQEAALSSHRSVIASYFNTRKASVRGGTVSGAGWAGELRCKDGWVWIQVPQEHQWQGFVEAMGNPEWAKDEVFRDRAARMKHAQEWEELVTAWTIQHTKEEVYHKAQARGVPIGMVSTPEDVVNSPQLAARGYFVEVDHPEAGRLKYPTVPYKLEKTPAVIQGPAPLLGQHNEEVLCGRLGYKKEDLASMRETGII